MKYDGIIEHDFDYPNMYTNKNFLIEVEALVSSLLIDIKYVAKSRVRFYRDLNEISAKNILNSYKSNIAKDIIKMQKALFHFFFFGYVDYLFCPQ